MPAATGITTYDGNFANRFVGIELSAALTPVSSIQGNNINGISFSTLNATTSGSEFLLVFRFWKCQCRNYSWNIIGSSTGIIFRFHHNLGINQRYILPSLGTVVK
jgi:hypothetical protein